MQGDHGLELLEEKIITDLSSPEIYGTQYVEYIRGYFHAVVAGDYQFGVMTDDYFIMKLSSVKNNANIANLETILSQDAYTVNHYSPYIRTNKTSTNTVSFTEGYYYF